MFWISLRHLAQWWVRLKLEHILSAARACHHAIAKIKTCLLYLIWAFSFHLRSRHLTEQQYFCNPRPRRSELRSNWRDIEAQISLDIFKTVGIVRIWNKVLFCTCGWTSITLYANEYKWRENFQIETWTMMTVISYNHNLFT